MIFTIALGALLAIQLAEYEYFENIYFLQNSLELLKYLKNLHTKNNADLPIKMMNFFDLYPPLPYGQRFILFVLRLSTFLLYHVILI